MRCSPVAVVVVAAVVVFAGVSAGCGPGKVDTLVQLSEQNDCAVDEDCCVVEESCSARVFLVTADEFDAAKDAAEFDEGGACNNCLVPATTVACVDGRCQGTAFSEEVTLAEGQGKSSCGPRAVTLDDDETDPSAQTFAQFFGCDSLSQ